MKKIVLYVISKCSLGSSDEEFLKNVCTFVCSKKDIREYISNKLLVENYSHYKSWLSLHYNSDHDIPSRRAEYLRTVINPEEFTKYSFKKNTYTVPGIASIFRILNGCIPVGASYESDAELKSLTNFFYELNKELYKEDQEEKVDILN
jgi:hypothetical protein